MDNLLTNDTKAIIMLCGVLGKQSSVRPLAQKEYTRLVQWLMNEKMRPEDLLKYDDIDAVAAASKIEADRLRTLLSRGVQLGFVVEKWQQNGIWIISRSDNDYPKKLKKHLQDKAPPLLFGIGNRSLLGGGGLAMVGSRNVDTDGIKFTEKIAELCAFNNMPVVSGGARGVDQIAMKSSLEAGGITVGILADNLLKKSLERHSREAITDGRLLLISPYHPNARFTVGTAMGRNKLIYAMADYSLVVSAEYNKGGTWTGAKEELNRDNSITVFSRQGESVPSGNKKLLELGAVEWPEKIEKESFLQQLTDRAIKLSKQKEVNISIYDYIDQQPLAVEEPTDKYTPNKTKENDVHQNSPADPIYEAVLPIILDHVISLVSADELSEQLNIGKSQLNKWLKKALEEKKIKKTSKPVRYQKTT